MPRAGSTEALGRALFEVLSHELTHQYIAERWVTGEGRRSASTPGFWVVEGMARFVEDQALEMGRRGIRFDDETVVCGLPSAKAFKQAVRKRITEW